MVGRATETDIVEDCIEDLVLDRELALQSTLVQEAGTGVKLGIKVAGAIRRPLKDGGP